MTAIICRKAARKKLDLFRILCNSKIEVSEVFVVYNQGRKDFGLCGLSYDRLSAIFITLIPKSRMTFMGGNFISKEV